MTDKTRVFLDENFNGHGQSVADEIQRMMDIRTSKGYLEQKLWTMSVEALPDNLERIRQGASPVVPSVAASTPPLSSREKLARKEEQRSRERAKAQKTLAPLREQQRFCAACGQAFHSETMKQYRCDNCIREKRQAAGAKKFCCGCGGKMIRDAGNAKKFAGIRYCSACVAEREKFFRHIQKPSGLGYKLSDR